MTTSCGSCSGSDAALFESRLSLPGRRRGKVRDVYDLPPDGQGRPRLLIVASDRLSAFDVVMPTPVPGKGRLLTAIAAFWLRWVEQRGLCQTHLLSTDADEVPASAFGPGDTPRASLHGRVMIARACRVVPVECVVRGYLEGSGWKDYLATGSVCGVPLPAGLRQCDRLPEPIFTPATKATSGHDENITREQAATLVGPDVLAEIERLSIALYRFGAEHAAARGIILADTKFELGRDPDGQLVLGDEALTPDSSRFWPADGYEPGRPQASFDKQYVRDYAEALGWDKTHPGPELPGEVVAGTRARYVEAFERITGIAFDAYLADPNVVRR